MAQCNAAAQYSPSWYSTLCVAGGDNELLNAVLTGRDVLQLSEGLRVQRNALSFPPAPYCLRRAMLRTRQ